MKKIRIAHLVLLLLAVSVLALAGCARSLQSVQTITGDESTGTSQVYAVNVETAKKISKQILADEDFVVQDKGNSLIARNTDFFYVEFTAANGGTKVRAVAVRKIPTNILVELTEGTFHERLAEQLKK
jgi:hypothetical protein